MKNVTKESIYITNVLTFLKGIGENVADLSNWKYVESIRLKEKGTVHSTIKLFPMEVWVINSKPTIYVY